MYLKDGELRGTTTCLWEAMTKCAVNVDEPDHLAFQELQRRLGQSSCMGFQEIGISPSPEGWVIHIRACNEDGKVDILIPKDRTATVKVLQDTRMISNSYTG
jgi:hypothetical protein